jgi:pimeloyl-ACP methyl ester carboxylesterase
MVKELLEESDNTRFILFNYNGQSHTIYDKIAEFKPSDFSAIIDKLIYRVSSYPNQLNIVQQGETFKLVGLGYGGYLVQSYLALSPEIQSIVKGVMLVNSSSYCTKKYREIYSSLLQLYSVEDPVTEENAFLFYNKAINSI